MQISSASIASTAADTANGVGIAMLKRQISTQSDQNAQLLASLPQAPRPGGSLIDVYA